ncbi:hypothetical protein HDU93_000607 [Gonapodya sp. JEL0774]|nr:hypothetical protein HDU93_000607 [Gonapodya sp. JEL0774]
MWIDTREMFVGEVTSTACLNDPVDGINGMQSTINLSENLLSREQEWSLNPLTITAISADFMPSNTMTYDQLFDQCMPVYMRFLWFRDTRPNELLARSRHAKSVKFGSRAVIVPGFYEAEALKRSILEQKLEVEVHDRDPRLVGGALTDLVYGVTSLNLTATVLPARHRCGIDISIPPGDWLKHGTVVKLKLKLGRPMFAEDGDGESTIGKFVQQLVPRYRVDASSGKFSRLVAIIALVHRLIGAISLNVLLRVFI